MKHASECTQLLRTRGLKVTASRCAVLCALAAARQPLSVDQIARRVPAVNVVTLYRMLERFVADGLVYQADFRNGKAYFEFQPEHHHHITCTTCGAQEAVDACVGSTQDRALAGSAHFARIHSHTLEFFGTCMKCTKRTT